DERLRQLIQSLLINVASFTSEHDPQKLLEPYNLQIEVKDIGKSLDGYQTIAEKPSGTTVIIWKSIESLSIRFKQFQKQAEEKGLSERMLKTLGNLGLSEKEILELSSEQIAQIFAPGTNLDGGGFDLDDHSRKELEKVGINNDMSLILFNLGYTSKDMLVLTPKEVDFIFPNTELVANLKQKGFSELDVQSKIYKGKTYKDIIKEALER
ncbi:MAG: hypothetical protein ACYCX4_08045, partial [Bacillota bacterium]